MIRLRQSLARAVIAASLLGLAAPVFMTSPAFAGGNVVVDKRDITEANGGWRVFMTVKLPRKPTIPHQTMRFLFTPLVIYETYLDDSSPGEKTRNLPQDKSTQAIVETLDVGFSNAANEVFDTTKFDFTIRRDRGFEAGEYKVEVRDGDDHVLGSTFNLKLSGKNNVIDRRTMVMVAQPKKKDPPKDAGAGGGSDASSDSSASAPAPADSSSPDAGAAAPPPADKPKGCGCDVPGQASSGGAVAIIALATGVGAFGSRRRNRRKLGWFAQSTLPVRVGAPLVMERDHEPAFVLNHDDQTVREASKVVPAHLRVGEVSADERASARMRVEQPAHAGDFVQQHAAEATPFGFVVRYRGS